MGANNWRECPKCLKVQKNAVDELKALYGKIPREDYEKRLSEVYPSPDSDYDYSSLREDWSLGVDEQGKFSVSYHCSCEECGLKFSFKHTEQLPL